MLTEEQYIRYYHKNKKTVDQVAFSKNSLNERQLASKYKKYVQKNKPKAFIVDEEWVKLREEIYERVEGMGVNVDPNIVIRELFNL